MKVHIPDNYTPYSHIHIYDKYANSLTTALQRAAYDAPEVHIMARPIQEETEWRLRK
jgi:hypothetical protein